RGWTDMICETQGPGLSGQRLVYAAWRAAAGVRGFALRSDLDLSSMIGELAHVSVLGKDADGFRFRLAGTGLRQTFAREAKGLLVDEIGACSGQAWDEGLRLAVLEARPVIGRSRMGDCFAHFWMRLPVSSDGRDVDLVLAHDRILPVDALGDPDRAARLADLAL